MLDGTPDVVTEDDIRNTAKQHPDYQRTLTYAKSGRALQKPQLGEYGRIREEIEAHDGILMRGLQMVIPNGNNRNGQDLRRKVVDLAHEAHSVEPGTKTTLRQALYFPGMDEEGRNIVSGCEQCLIAVKTEKRDPMKPSKLSEEPYEVVNADHYGPVTDRRGEKKHVLVMIDSLTKYLELGVTKSTAAANNIPVINMVLKTSLTS